MMTSTLPIGDFSRATHLSVKMLRHYHELGLLEPVYVLVLAYELERRRLLTMRRHLVPLGYHGVHIEVGFRAGPPICG